MTAFANFEGWTAAITAISEMNGAFEIGISAGVDAALPESQRLAVIGPDGVEDGEGAAGNGRAIMDGWLSIVCTSALAIFISCGIRDENILIAGVCGAIGIVMADLIGENGDVRVVDCTYNDAGLLPSGHDATVTAIMNAMTNRQRLNAGVLCALSTKVNWFAMNHHVGQGEFCGYARKVFCGIVCPDATPEQIIQGKNMMYVLGHWADTARCMKALNVTPVLAERISRKYFHGCAVPVISLTLALDLSIRLANGSVPSGASKFGLARAIVKRVFRHQLCPFFPGFSDIGELAAVSKLVDSAPLLCHPSALWISGRSQDVAASECGDGLLGRLGTFICVLYPHSSIAKSPHLIGQKFREYDDYDDSWNSVVTQYKTASALPTMLAKQILSNIAGSISGGAIQTLSAEVIAQLGGDKATLDQRFEAANAIVTSSKKAIKDMREVKEKEIAPDFQ